MRPRRSLPFPPANRVELHDKALAAGPVLLCLDLEDAGPALAKAEARATGVAFLTAAKADVRTERDLRINALRTADGIRDMSAVLDAAPEAGAMFMPKVIEPGEVRLASGFLVEADPDIGLGMLIETAERPENAAAVPKASNRIAFAMPGGADLAAEQRVAVADEPLRHARVRPGHAATLAEVELLDVPCLAFRNAEITADEARHARMPGHAGKAAPHPAGPAAIHDAFSRDAGEIARAETVVGACHGNPIGLARIDGKIIDKPVVRAAGRIVALNSRLNEATQVKEQI